MIRTNMLTAWLVPITGAVLLTSAFQGAGEATAAPDARRSAPADDPPGTVVLAEPGSPFVAC
ncbi:MAG TPA: hypothetical protein VLA43_03730, partial [Longimicrobiales bacterium]|nr:hypothetical protein [Longimicrobiales bacterium]